MDSKTTVGDRLKKARQDAGLTQAQLALNSGLTPDWICSIERGKRRAELPTLMKLAGALGVTIGFVLGEKTDTKTTSKGNSNGKEHNGRTSRNGRNRRLPAKKD